MRCESGISILALVCKFSANLIFRPVNTLRSETRALLGGGGGEYSYIRVLPDEFFLKLTLMTADFKRNSSGRTRRYEYSTPPPSQLTFSTSAVS